AQCQPSSPLPSPRRRAGLLPAHDDTAELRTSKLTCQVVRPVDRIVARRYVWSKGKRMKLQAVSNRKLYIQIADQIREQILNGAVEPGRQLPSERDLAQNLGVSRPTVREALIAL